MALSTFPGITGHYFALTAASRLPRDILPRWTKKRHTDSYHQHSVKGRFKRRQDCFNNPALDFNKSIFIRKYKEASPPLWEK